MGKLTIEFNSQVTKKLGELAKKEGRSKTEILRRAIGLYSHLDREMVGLHDERYVAIIDKEDRILSKLKWL